MLFPGAKRSDNVARMKTLGIAARAAALLLIALPVDAQLRAFTAARLIDGTGRATVANATILVRDGRIAAVGPAGSVAIPPEAERVNLRGSWVIPGLINAHGHVNASADLAVYAAHGTTTVFTLGDAPDDVFAMRDAQGSPSQSRARVFISSPALAVFAPDSARDLVRAGLRPGRRVDLVKIRVDDNLGTTRKSPEEGYAAAILAAHQDSLRVAAHLYYLEDARRLLAHNVDILAHSVRDVDVDPEFVQSVVDKRVCYIPTLMREVSTYVYESTPWFFSDPVFLARANKDWVTTLSRPDRQLEYRNSAAGQTYKAQLPVAKRNLKKLVDAGALVAMGTDTGPFGRFQGYFELLELAEMVDAGMSPGQAIIAATRDAARCHKVERDLGTLEVGKWADFLVLAADPLANIGNVRRIAGVFIAGNRVQR